MHREMLWHFSARWFILGIGMEEMILPQKLRKVFHIFMFFLKICQKSLDNFNYWKYNSLVM